MKRSTLFTLLTCFVLGCAPTPHTTDSAIAGSAKGEPLLSTVKSAPMSSPQVIFTTSSGNVTVSVEVARTPQQRSKGLMFRETLADDKGMLFIFEHSSRQTFWMKNTLIPLDMIFVEHGGRDGVHRVVGIVADAVPHDLTPRGVDAASRFVVEVPGGWAKRAGIRTGDQMRIEGVAFNDASHGSP